MDHTAVDWSNDDRPMDLAGFLAVIDAAGADDDPLVPPGAADYVRQCARRWRPSPTTWHGWVEVLFTAILKFQTGEDSD